MAAAKKRDIFELNKFQEQVLGPFYAACLFVVIFLGAVSYLFFYPQSQPVEEMVVLTQCQNNIPSLIIPLTTASVMISLTAMFLINRIHGEQLKGAASAPGEFSPVAVRVTRLEMATVVAGIACLLAFISLFCLAYLLLGGGNIGTEKENFYFLLKHGLSANRDFFIFTGMTIIMTVAALFYWSYLIANKVLGPYERVLRELDEMVDKGVRKKLVVRDGDEMFGELVKRVNSLLKLKD